MSAETVNDILGYVSTAVFGLLGIVSLVYWRRRRDRPSLWSALCFGTIGAVALAGQVLPETATTTFELAAQRALVVVLLLFPYLLFRFTAAFDPASRALEWTAAIVTTVLIVWTIALPDFPQTGEHRSAAFDVYLYALARPVRLPVDLRLVPALAGRPRPAERRPHPHAPAQRRGDGAHHRAHPRRRHARGRPRHADHRLGLGILSGLLFLLGFAPPEVVRAQWRRPEQERVRNAIGSLMTLTTPPEIAANVLPAMRSLVGAEAIFLLDANGKVLGASGRCRAAGGAATGSLQLEIPGGSLIVGRGPYAPFFGSDELDLLRSLGALTGSRSTGRGSTSASATSGSPSSGRTS